MSFWWKKPWRGRWTFVLIPFAAGIAVTLAASFAMHTTDSAAFCGSCHSMAEAALTHSTSVHAQFACNECHAPHNLIPKIPFKTKEGARDVYKTVTYNVPDLIHPNETTLTVIQNNCLRCHGSVIKEVNMLSKDRCTDCHRHVPHSPKTPVAKRSAADA
ncbi:NapC/NirT family cytochrome c [Desulfatiferula olefinivorans]